MSLLNSRFDVVPSDAIPLAHAALAEVLDAAVPTPPVDVNGTPVPGSIGPGAFVTIHGTTGLAVAADNATTGIIMCVLDGDTDLSGAFTRKLSCLVSGYKIKTDNYLSEAWNINKGAPVYLDATGALTLVAGAQVVGYVAKEGEVGTFGVDGVLHLLVP